jgi:hypothetical protein
MKKTYFLVAESALAFALSMIALPVESILALAVSATALTVESAAFTVESTLASVLDPLLQAAKQPIDNTNKSFFMLIMFLLLSDWF